MSLNRMILCTKLKNGLCQIVTKSQVVTKFNVSKSRLHCMSGGQKSESIGELYDVRKTKFLLICTNRAVLGLIILVLARM